jgi:RNA ligase
MKYQFPIIEHLDDVRPAIEGRDEFIIAEREWGYVVNYMVAMADTFPEVKTAGGSAKMREEANRYKAIRRECRGLLFDKSGKVMARRLHKFFNVNERDETQFHAIDFTQPHVILEKLDGSMITPVVTDAGLRWGTKMGITDVSMGAELFVANNVRYADFAREVLAEGKTPIFEWCSRQQRIVVDYPRDRLVLIAIRDNRTGEYVSYDVMVNWAHKHMVESVQSYPGTAKSMVSLMAETKDAEGIEGWIIRFDDGQMLKIKGEWYLRIHKTKDNLTFEKNVVDLLVNEKIDDAKAFMLEEDRHRVEQFEQQFWKGFEIQVAVTESIYKTVYQHFKGDRKQFAIEHAAQLHSVTRAVMFACWDGKKTIREELLNAIRKNTGTQTKIDEVRWLWAGARWDYRNVGNE